MPPRGPPHAGSALSTRAGESVLRASMPTMALMTLSRTHDAFRRQRPCTLLEIGVQNGPGVATSLPSRPHHCRATPTEWLPFLGNADGSNVITRPFPWRDLPCRHGRSNPFCCLSATSKVRDAAARVLRSAQPPCYKALLVERSLRRLTAEEGVAVRELADRPDVSCWRDLGRLKLVAAVLRPGSPARPGRPAST